MKILKGLQFAMKNRTKIGEVKETLYVDDTHCILSDQKSIEIWIQHLHTYERASGAVGNFIKSYGLLLCILKGFEHLCDKIKWPEGKIAALGVNHGIQIEDTIFLNKKIDKLIF